MAIVATAISPSVQGIFSAAAGTLSGNTTTLVSITVGGTTPSQQFVVSPVTALATGAAIGQAYCTTAGTVVVPFINPTSGSVDVGDVNVRLTAI